MRWQGRRQSSNIRDVRGSGGGGGFGGGRVIRAGGGMGIGTIIIVLIVAWLFGINPLTLLGAGGGGGYAPAPSQRTGTQASAPSSEADGQMRDFVATVLADTEDTWTQVFQQAGRDYPLPTLTLFSGRVDSACGTASAASGPFYCPNDQNVYIDLSFYNQLRQRFGAPGDFAQAYVLAHEVGHHVQNVLGILKKSQELQSRAGQADANAISVRTELQADCFAGVWANHTRQKGLLEEGDISEAMTAASSVGDDAIQERTQGYVVPESFNHGTSQQRTTWFRRGLEGGTIDSCDTFAGQI